MRKGSEYENIIEQHDYMKLKNNDGDRQTDITQTRRQVDTKIGKKGRTRNIRR